MGHKKDFSLAEISRARSHLMGLAALWIVLFHSIFLNFYQPWLLEHPHLMDILNRLREEGNCGVDIFLFLSGVGLVFSWTRLKENAEHPLREFYRRRLARVVPAMLVVSMIYYGIMGTKDAADWLGKVLLYGQFSPVLEGGRYWFFSLLLALYLLFPLIWRVVDRGGLAGTIGLIVFSVLCLLAVRWWISESYFDKMEILWTRIPIFVVGVYFGGLIREDKKIPRWIPILALPLALLVWYEIRLIPEDYTFLRRYAYGVLTLLIVLAHAWLCSLRKEHGLAHRGVIRVGEYSLELYLIYENLYLYNPLQFQSPDPIGIIYMVSYFVVSLLLSTLLRLGLERLRTKKG